MKYRISVICAHTGEVLGEAITPSADEANEAMTVLSKPSMFGNDNFVIHFTSEE